MQDNKNKVNNRIGYFLNNVGSSFVYQITAIISSFILPRMFIEIFGSATNGLVNSITQFLSYISLLDLGVGAVFQSALYKPLARKDKDEINNVFCAGRNFYKKIGIIIFIYIVALSIIYPFIVQDRFEYISTMILVISMSISMFAQYYLGLAYQVFLTADQKHYVQANINTGTLILNTIVSIILLKLGFCIQIVKLATSFIFVLRPLLMKWYVDRHYDIDYKYKPSNDAIPQKWNGFAQHLAAVILNNTDVAVLTVFSTLENVSIYSIYYMVVSAIKQAIYMISSAMTPALGNMYGCDENEKFKSSYNLMEWFTHMISNLFFCVTAILITQFVLVYTKGVKDTNYDAPLFGMLISLAGALICMQLPYKSIIQVVGHYKETQYSSIIESVINIVVSILMVKKFGLLGVAIGTIMAIFYRMIYLEQYIQKNIIKRNKYEFIKLLTIDVLLVGIMIFSTSFINTEILTITRWIINAIIVFVICTLCLIVVNFLFYKERMFAIINRILKK